MDINKSETKPMANPGKFLKLPLTPKMSNRRGDKIGQLYTFSEGHHGHIEQ